MLPERHHISSHTPSHLAEGKAVVAVQQHTAPVPSHPPSLPPTHLAEGKAVVPVQQHTADTPSIRPLGVVALDRRSACITCRRGGGEGEVEQPCG